MATMMDVWTTPPTYLAQLREGIIKNSPASCCDGNLNAVRNPFTKYGAHTQKALDAIAQCGQAAMSGQCASGHQYLKAMLCNYEYCPTCGKRGSPMHMRRFARILPKGQQLTRQGYFVIEFQKRDRHKFLTKEALERAGRIIRGVLEDSVQVDVLDAAGEPVRMALKDGQGNIKLRRDGQPRTKKVKRWGSRGIARGITAWDYFGDPKCPKCHQPGHWDDENDQWTCHGHGPFTLGEVHSADMSPNPHLNILTDSGFLDYAVIDDLQERLSLALLGKYRRETIRDTNGDPIRFAVVDVQGQSQLREKKRLVEGVIVHYQYIELKKTATGEVEDTPDNDRKIRQMLHRLRYIVKPTFLRVDWDPALAEELHKFQAIASWGKWNDEAAWQLKHTEDSDELLPVIRLQAHKCPHLLETGELCGKKVEWKGYLNAAEVANIKRFYAITDLGGGYSEIGLPQTRSEGGKFDENA